MKDLLGISQSDGSTEFLRIHRVPMETRGLARCAEAQSIRVTVIYHFHSHALSSLHRHIKPYHKGKPLQGFV